MSDHKWRTGAPPFPHWWNTGPSTVGHEWRWWNGRYWSAAAYEYDDPSAVAHYAKTKSVLRGITWNHYWPPGARVPKVNPMESAK